jgi:tetratricopeptide (TPR) repeat protein
LQRRFWFTSITILTPLFFLLAFELLLRLVHYGPDLSLFNTEVIAGKTYYIMNQSVKGRYFVKTDFRPNTSPDYFAMPKPAGTFRIFCLGGSTTVGFPYGFAGSFSSFLRDRLRYLFPEKSVEVINLGMTATNSYTVLDIAKEVMEYEPDMFCVYDGHNEFYGAFGVASHESVGLSRQFTMLYLRLVHYRTFLLVRDLYWTLTGWFQPRPTGEFSGTMMERLARGQYIRYGSELYVQALEDFKTNLNELRTISTRHKVFLLLASQVSNQRDLPPFISQDLPYWTPKQKLHFHTLYNNALEKLLNQQPDSALRLLEEVLRLDSVRADVHFALARCLDSLKRKREARNEYEKARDYDMLRFRASTDFNDAIKQMDDGHMTFFVDVEKKFKANSLDSLIGNNLITEHLHPNERGYFLIAKEFTWPMHVHQILADEITWNERDRLDDDKLWERRPLTELDELCAQRRTHMLTSGWPFRQETRDLPPIPSEDTLGILAARMVQGEVTWEEGHVAATDFYTRRGQLEKAEREYMVLINQIPLNVSAYLLLGQLCLKQGKNMEAAGILLQSTKVEPTVFAYHVLGKLALNPGDAMSFFEKALALSIETKDRVESGFLLAEACYRGGRTQEAVSHLQQVLQWNSSFAPARGLLNRIHGMAK